MDLVVTLPDSRSITISISRNTLVCDAKIFIAENEGLQESMFDLTVEGDVLDETRNINSYGIHGRH